MRSSNSNELKNFHGCKTNQAQLASQPCANLYKLIDPRLLERLFIHGCFKSISQPSPPLQLIISLSYFFTRVKIQLDADGRKLLTAVCAGVITQKFPAAASVCRNKKG
jgi:hypothetical protein